MSENTTPTVPIEVPVLVVEKKSRFNRKTIAVAVVSLTAGVAAAFGLAQLKKNSDSDDENETSEDVMETFVDIDAPTV